MSLNWSLKELYVSFESEEFKIDMNRLTNKINEINIWADEVINSEENILEKYQTTELFNMIWETYLKISQ